MSDALTSDIRQEANAALLEVDKGTLQLILDGWWASIRNTSVCMCDLHSRLDVIAYWTCWDVEYLWVVCNEYSYEYSIGLRASRVGDQCEAIVKFPSLVDRFPFPILINAAYLKLAEVFRTG